MDKGENKFMDRIGKTPPLYPCFNIGDDNHKYLFILNWRQNRYKRHLKHYYGNYRTRILQIIHGHDICITRDEQIE